MIITMKKLAPKVEVDRMIENIEEKGLHVTMISGSDYNVFGVAGDTTMLDMAKLKALPNVADVQRVSAPYKLTNRMFHPADTVVEVGGIKIGGNAPVVVIGGPCSIESEDHTFEMARLVKEAGACMLRGGAYKPRSSPYGFQGLGVEG